MGEWLRSVVGGHIRYYGVPMNCPALVLFRFRVGRLWHRALSRRSQNGRGPSDSPPDSAMDDKLGVIEVIDEIDKPPR